ncbi:UNVERIFIED_CONTAM: hypothetical protein GTU68_040869 [Idotea baltica]|nr:hypothetical protein [Idotea baltica]
MQSFIAAEDLSFYNHPGIDLISILRAFIKNLKTGSIRQGGSTITQQVIKNLLLSSDKKLERKIKEAILAYRIEKKLTKDEILGIYLNQIFFGSQAYGIQSASKTYFNKDISELSIAEGAILAGLPQAPSRYSPINNLKAAKNRQKYVLKQMLKANFINKSQFKSALDEEIIINKKRERKIRAAEYYVSEVRNRFKEKFPDYNLETDGIKITTALDLDSYKIARLSLQKGLREVDKRRGWRGGLYSLKSKEDVDAFRDKYSKKTKTLDVNEIYRALVISKKGNNAELIVNNVIGTLDLSQSSWAKKVLKPDDKYYFSDPSKTISVGDVIEVSLDEEFNLDKKNFKFKLDQTPKIESALVLINPHNGEVPVIIGGYDYQRSEFNRATQSRRQPGSAFKPIVYLTAIDAFNYTPSTIIYDEEKVFKIGNDYWRPGNYDKNFLGPITLRTALERSRNLVSVDLISKIGIDPVIKYGRKLGIKSKLGRNLSLSLGSAEVSPLEITRAYGVFASSGLLYKSIFIKKVEDRNGAIIFDSTESREVNQVIPPETAFVMANLMKGVVESGTGYKVKALGRPVAAKTGTSNDQMDAWFVGYTPEWVCGVWTGFDVKKEIGPKETGGRVSAPIWLDFMQNYLNNYENNSSLKEKMKEEYDKLAISFNEDEKLEYSDFSIPDNIDSYWINKKTGVYSQPNTTGVIKEYYIKGTKPNAVRKKQVEELYLDDPYL